MKTNSRAHCKGRGGFRHGDKWSARVRVLSGLLAVILGTGFPAHALGENGDAAVPPPPAPVIHCDEPVFSFGDRSTAASVAHVFVIWNRGDAPLEISRVRACCGATATLADQVVAPGTNTTVRVVASLRGRRGQVQRNIYVASNDPRQPQYRLGLVGSVAAPAQAPPAAAPQTASAPPPVVRELSPTAAVPPDAPAPAGSIRAVPAELQLAPEADAAPLDRTLLLRSADQRSFQVTRVDCPSDDWRVDLRPLAPGLWRVRIRHIVNGAAFDGQAVRIHTDVPDFEVVTVPIRWGAQ